jgi:hypothetical protein
MALLALGVIVGGLFLLQRFGVLPNFSLSWDLAWRTFLNILLVLGIFGLVSKIWSIVVVLGRFDAKLISPSRDPLVDIASTALLALALYGVSRRRRWGAYLILARLVFTIAVQVFVYRSVGWRLVGNYTGLENVFADLSGAMMWLVAFNRNWAAFR